MAVPGVGMPGIEGAVDAAGVPPAVAQGWVKPIAPRPA